MFNDQLSSSYWFYPLSEKKDSIFKRYRGQNSSTWTVATGAQIQPWSLQNLFLYYEMLLMNLLALTLTNCTKSL